MKNSLLFLGFFLSIQLLLQAQPVVPGDVHISKDLVYNIVGEDTLLLDIYWHKQAKTNEPLIVWIHGGGWRKGSKNNPKAAVKLLDQGYAVASINYRLSHRAIFPAQIMDCKAAIRWLKAHAANFNADSSRIAVWGASAGGHLSALLGTSWQVREWDSLGGYKDLSSKVHAVCDWYGPTDFFRMDDRPGKFVHSAAESPEGWLVGGAIAEHKALVTRANPITHIKDGTPPFLIMHGVEDALVLWEQSQLLHEALQKKGQHSELLLFDDLGHGGRGWGEMYMQALNFFDKVFK